MVVFHAMTLAFIQLEYSLEFFTPINIFIQIDGMMFEFAHLLHNRAKNKFKGSFL